MTTAELAPGYRGLALSALIAVAAMWGGLALSYQFAALPPSSAIIGLADAGYAAVTLFARARRQRSDH